MKKPPDAPKQPYEVGYGKPPADTRFKPGTSGNPTGRPKGSLNLATAVNRAMKEKVTIVENGRRKSVSKLDAAVKGLVNRAVKGDARACQQMLALAPLVGMEPAKAATALDQTETEIVASLFKRLTGSGNDPTSDVSQLSAINQENES